ncbi:MAG TPA: hypothetical protein VGU20_27830 [Stellaceae bacterium]|nr:hypothetical protein [Stellaceae bacterium]
MEMNCPPEILARDFAGNVMIGVLSPDTIWDPPQKAVAYQIDYLKPLVWIGGALLPWAGIAALLVRR